MIICNKCKNENKEGAKFCKFCGNIMEDDISPEKSTAPAFEPTPMPMNGPPENLEPEDLRMPPESPMSRPPELGRDFTPTTRKIAETGEVLELVDREAEQENLHILSSTFADTLTQLARSREELANIEERIADALKVQRDREEKKLRDIQANYELTQKKIQALEELSLLRKLREGEDKLAAIFRGEDVELEGSILAGIGEGEEEDDLEELEDLDDTEDLEDLEDLDEFMEDEEEVRCPECDTLVSMDAAECPNCGVEFE